MDQAVARSVAHYSHVRQCDRRGVPIVEHLARVVAAVPAEAQPLAWLHDVLEHSPTTTGELRGQGLTPLELAALDLLTPGRRVLRAVHPADRLRPRRRGPAGTRRQAGRPRRSHRSAV